MLLRNIFATGKRKLLIDMFTALCNIHTLHEAWKQVKSNNSAGGIDGLSVLEFEENLDQNLHDLYVDLTERTWNPEPYLRIEVEKNKTEKRKLGLLTVKDKIVQQAIKTLIEPLFENVFLNNSYGYRPGRGHTKAIRRTVNEISQMGDAWVVRLDIDNYFDTVDHEVLFSSLKALIDSDEILRLIELSVKMGIVSKRLKWTNIKAGVPQGAILSPLLSNFYLHSFDLFVTGKTNAYVRYADDFLIFAKTKKEIDELLIAASVFLQTRLKLKLNRPLVCEINQGIEFLGVVVGRDGITLSEEKKIKLLNEIRSLKWVGGCFTRESLQSLSGIQRYYARLLPQELLIPLDEALKEKITSLLLTFHGEIPNKKRLSETLKQMPFFSNKFDLGRKQLIDEWLKLYSEKKKEQKAMPADAGLNKRLINRKKQEYRKKESEGSELIVSMYGSFIGKNQQGITVKANGKSVRKAPSRALKHIIVTSRGVGISSDAIQYCMENRIPVDFFDHGGKHYASILSPVSVEQSLWQQQAGMDVERKAYLASRIIYGKMKNQLHLVKYFHKYHKAANAVLEECYGKTAACLKELIEKSKNVRPENDGYREELMACEAQGAVAYWEYVRQLFADDEIDFESRERRGATDLFNSLLNYGYAILYPRVWQAVLSAKLNPSISVLHAFQPGKPVFTYDIIEIFRAQAVDRVVISLVQKSEPLDMDKNLLSEETRRLLALNVLERINRYEKYRGGEIQFADIIRQQVREIASYISGESKTFKPYIAKW